MSTLAKMLIYTGLVLVTIGLLVHYAPWLPLRLGRLPGDIEIRGRHGRLFFPLATCLLISIVASIVSYLLNRR